MSARRRWSALAVVLAAMAAGCTAQMAEPESVGSTQQALLSRPPPSCPAGETLNCGYDIGPTGNLIKTCVCETPPPPPCVPPACNPPPPYVQGEVSCTSSSDCVNQDYPLFSPDAGVDLLPQCCSGVCLLPSGGCDNGYRYMLNPGAAASYGDCVPAPVTCMPH
jgi:hypothetical protein